ncbi:MAG: methionyl-tRNA formyltransferase [Alphaproteobacteria bacterium]|jgi:methionyl-tRNA formyltransferase|nr:methionyl-tRNA formyltransferase [Alphaproteobacteria bacterium]
MAAKEIIFMGTPDYAVPSLDALLAAGFSIKAVYCQPPRPAGRGKQPRHSAVGQRAEAAGLELRMPVSLKDGAEQHALAALKADLCIVVAYGLILPPAVLAAPRLGCINAHASLLPRWRGAAPIQRAIMAGDSETGVSIMRMDEGLDTGPVLRQVRLAIEADCDAGQLHDRLAALSASLLVEVVGELCRGEAPPATAQGAGASYAAKIDKAETRLDWNRPAPELANLVRALAPAPGAWFEHGAARIKLLAARAEAHDGADAPGTVLGAGDGLRVACGHATSLRLTRLHRAGKGVLAAAEFLRGHAIAAGETLPCRATN